MKSNILNLIVDTKKKEIEELYASTLASTKVPPIKGNLFYNAISKPKLSLIAEIKKASPSKGIIRKDFNPITIAEFFIDNHAAALSILTEKHYFLGHPDYLINVKNKFNIPVLRKDFIIDPIQIKEAAQIGANAILLIKAILTRNECKKLISEAKKYGLDVLMEVHSQEECEAIIDLDLDIIGINNRNLKTFEVDLNTAPTLKNFIRSMKEEILVVAESGYQTLDELKMLQAENFNAVLIGEGLALDSSIISFFN